MSSDKTNGKTVADNVLDAANIVKISLEYNIKTGAFNMNGNIRDEVITNGMLEMAKDRMREQYNFQRLKDQQAKMETAIVAPGGMEILS